MYTSGTNCVFRCGPRLPVIPCPPPLSPLMSPPSSTVFTNLTRNAVFKVLQTKYMNKSKRTKRKLKRLLAASKNSMEGTKSDR